MTEPVALTEEQAPEIAAFTRIACEFDFLSTGSVRRSLFADPDPHTVLGLYNGGLEGVAAGVVRNRRGWVKLLAVHPRRRRSGVGTLLREGIEAFCREQGARSIEVGSSAPYYVVPGVDVRVTEAVCMFQSAGYERTGDAVNLSVRLHGLPDPELGVQPAGGNELERIRPWVEQTHPGWLNELERAVAQGTCLVSGDAGFACYDVNRDGWFGPIATRNADRGTGIGEALLLTALHRMHKRGYERADIAWAAALPFYMKTVGARISRVFWHYAKAL